MLLFAFFYFIISFFFWLVYIHIDFLTFHITHYVVSGSIGFKSVEWKFYFEEGLCTANILYIYVYIYGIG